jgi:type VI secretion system protein VasG
MATPTSKHATPSRRRSHDTSRSVDPKSLVRRLNPATTRMLEGAVGHAAGGQFYEITCDHLLLKLLESEDGDAALILQHFGQRKAILAQRIQRSLERMKTGNTGRPVFAEQLFQWIEDAWVVASLTWGATTLRSGHLLLQFIERSSRYIGDTYAELDAINLGELRKSYEDIVARSSETPPAEAPGGAGAPAPGPQASAGDEHIKRFTTSFTDDARAGKIDPIFGRHTEIRQLIDILGRRRKNNPIIVGEPGVGKSALVEGLALAIVSGDVPDMLREVDLRGLDLGPCRPAPASRASSRSGSRASSTRSSPRRSRSSCSSTRPTP